MRWRTSASRLIFHIATLRFCHLRVLLALPPTLLISSHPMKYRRRTNRKDNLSYANTEDCSARPRKISATVTSSDCWSFISVWPPFYGKVKFSLRKCSFINVQWQDEMVRPFDVSALVVYYLLNARFEGFMGGRRQAFRV